MENQMPVVTCQHGFQQKQAIRLDHAFPSEYRPPAGAFYAAQSAAA
jgi:hypothetical protein